MARIIYDNDQPSYELGGYNNHGYNGYNGYNGGYILLTIVILLLLFFWSNSPRLRNLDYWLTDNVNSTIRPAEAPITRNNTEIRYVTADNLNLREDPSNLARVSDMLPRGTKVVVLGESHQDADGEVWLRVKAASFAGTQVGWVSQLWLGRNQNTVTTPPAKRSITVPVTEIRYVTVENLALRERPNDEAQVSYYLPAGVKVTLLGNTYQDSSDEVWLKVRVETFDGRQVGWVRQQYLE